MRAFRLNRKHDATGVSGTGIVAEGVQFDNGKCVISWLTDVTSVAVYDGTEDVEKIHGHDGQTLIEWGDRGMTPVCVPPRDGLPDTLLVGLKGEDTVHRVDVDDWGRRIAASLRAPPVRVWMGEAILVLTAVPGLKVEEEWNKEGARG